MSTIEVGFFVISWGSSKEDDSTNVWDLETGPSATDHSVAPGFSAGDSIQGLDATQLPGASNAHLKFVYWNATDGTNVLPGYPRTDPVLNIKALGSNVSAIAWYADPVGPPGTSTPQLRARTFDVDRNLFRKETPIKSAAPAGVWPGPNQHSVSTESGPVKVTAKAALDFPAPSKIPPPGTLAKAFVRWQKILGGVTASGQELGCGAHHSALSVAFYGNVPASQAPKVEIDVALSEVVVSAGVSRDGGGTGTTPSGHGVHIDPLGPPVVSKVLKGFKGAGGGGGG